MPKNPKEGNSRLAKHLFVTYLNKPKKNKKRKEKSFLGSHSVPKNLQLKTSGIRFTCGLAQDSKRTRRETGAYLQAK